MSLCSIVTWFPGAKRTITVATLVLFSLSLAVVLSGVVPPFSEDTARAVNVSFNLCVYFVHNIIVIQTCRTHLVCII